MRCLIKSIIRWTGKGPQAENHHTVTRVPPSLDHPGIIQHSFRPTFATVLDRCCSMFISGLAECKDKTHYTAQVLYRPKEGQRRTLAKGAPRWSAIAAHSTNPKLTRVVPNLNFSRGVWVQQQPGLHTDTSHRLGRASTSPSTCKRHVVAHHPP